MVLFFSILIHHNKKCYGICFFEYDWDDHIEFYTQICVSDPLTLFFCFPFLLTLWTGQSLFPFWHPSAKPQRKKNCWNTTFSWGTFRRIQFCLSVYPAFGFCGILLCFNVNSLSALLLDLPPLAERAFQWFFHLIPVLGKGGLFLIQKYLHMCVFFNWLASKELTNKVDNFFPRVSRWAAHHIRKHLWLLTKSRKTSIFSSAHLSILLAYMWPCFSYHKCWAGSTNTILSLLLEYDLGLYFQMA